MQHATSPSRLVIWAGSLSLASAITIALAALAGWVWDVEILRSMAPGFVSMKVNTALGVLLIACGVALSTNDRWRYLVAGCSLGVLALAALSLVQDFWVWDLGIDNLLVPDRHITSDLSSPGRMSPSSAFCFFTAALALLISSWTNAPTVHSLATTSGGAFLVCAASLALLGHFTEGLLGTRWWNYAGMALNTSLAFLFLGVGLWTVACRFDPPRWSMDGTASRWLAIALLALLLAVTVSYHYSNQIKQLFEAAQASHHTEIWNAQVSQKMATTFLILPLTGLVSLATLIVLVCVLNKSIGAQQAAAQELQLSLRTVRDIKTALDAHAIVAITDRFGRITDVNEKFCAISGFPRAELIGKDHRILNSGFHPPEFMRELWATIKSGAIWHGEIKNRTKQGEYYWVDTTIVPFLDEQGKPAQFIAIRSDITRRKHVEEELRESSRHFRTMANSMAQLAWIAQANGDLIWFNDRWYEYTGGTAEEMLGWGWQRAHDPSVLPSVVEQWQAARDAGIPFEMSFPLRGADGRFRTFLACGQPLKDAEGHVLQWFGTCTDVEAIKQAELQIRQINQELELRVAERTEQLQTSNRELEAFSYSVSHDLRAPLRAVDGFSQAVLEDYGPLLPEEGQRFLLTIRRAAQQMGTLIDDLLKFSRLSKAPLQRDTVDMQLLLLSVIHDFERAYPAAQLQIQELPPCSGDQGLLRQVWINLLSNAFKYSQRCETPLVEVGFIPDQGCYFVRDNGAGFDMKYSDKLFGVFQRLHRAEDYEGTGVGLAIVQRIIHRHGGRIWAQAAVNCGATFYFRLGHSL